MNCFLQIILQLVVSTLCLTRCFAQSVPISPQQYKLRLNASPEEINNLSVITAGDINAETNEDVDSLIEKVKQVTNRYKKDVDGTIAEVQQVLEQDYSLPRLTRGEIVEILDNLTNTDIETLVKNRNGGRKDYQRALMLVMPYTFKDSSNLNVEELYTKPPITHIVGTDGVIHKKNVQILGTKSTVVPFAPTIEVTPLEESTLRTPNLKKRKRPILDVTSEIPTVETTRQTEEPKIYVTTFKPKKQIIITKQPSTKPDFVASTHRPVYTKPTRHFNHKYPEEYQQFRPSYQQGMRIVSPPPYGSKTDAWQQNYPVKYKPTNIRTGSVQSSVYKAPLSTSTHFFRPTPQYTTTTTQTPVLHIDIPDNMKDVIKELELAEPSKVKNKYSSQYVASEVKFEKQPSTESIHNILGLIGQSQTTAKMPDLNNVADTLTPEMKDLLMTFGLIEDPNRPPEVTPPSSPFEPDSVDIQPASYTQFKPLPDTAPSRDDMYEFLSSYGLIGGGRAAKKLKDDKDEIQVVEESHKSLVEVPKIDLDMIPDHMHDVLEDMGLTQSRRSKKIRTDELTKIQEKTHVFNPVESSAAIKQLKRLNQLMETLERLEKLNRTVTEEDFRDVDLDNIAELTKILGNNEKIVPLGLTGGPNPLNFDKGLEKNEVKRQEASSTTSSPVVADSDSSADEEPHNPPISALEESFGGPMHTKLDEATLPPPRQTGFYYLVDWNSFLEVGEEGKNRVKIHFSPKAGDPSRFLKVTVP